MLDSRWLGYFGFTKRLMLDSRWLGYFDFNFFFNLQQKLNIFSFSLLSRLSSCFFCSSQSEIKVDKFCDKLAIASLLILTELPAMSLSVV